MRRSLFLALALTTVLTAPACAAPVASGQAEPMPTPHLVEGQGRFVAGVEGQVESVVAVGTRSTLSLLQ